MIRLFFLAILISFSLAQKYPCEYCTEEETNLFEAGLARSKRAPRSSNPECMCMYQFNDTDGYHWLSRYPCDIDWYIDHYCRRDIPNPNNTPVRGKTRLGYWRVAMMGKWQNVWEDEYAELVTCAPRSFEVADNPNNVIVRIPAARLKNKALCRRVLIFSQDCGPDKQRQPISRKPENFDTN
jgi:hypothetical protein